MIALAVSVAVGSLVVGLRRRLAVAARTERRLQFAGLRCSRSACRSAPSLLSGW